MRIDKFLKVSRLTKRRETARALCDAGLVSMNGKVAKPSSEVDAGSLLVLRMGRRVVTAKVLSVRPYANKDEAQKMYQIESDEPLKEDATDGIQDN